MVAPDWIALGAAPLPSGPVITYAATPPASPQSGDLWYLPADATNGVVWVFRYNSGSASSFKWEFIGGPPWAITPALFRPSATASYQSDTAAGSTITVPRA